MQTLILSEPALVFVNVSGLVLSAATLRTMGTRAATSTVEGHSLGTRAAAFSGGNPHIFSRCADEAGGAKWLKPNIARHGPRLVFAIQVRSGPHGEGEVRAQLHKGAECGHVMSANTLIWPLLRKGAARGCV